MPLHLGLAMAELSESGEITDPKQPLGLGREASGFAESLSHRGREPVAGSWGRGVGAGTQGRAGAESPVVERFHRRGFDKPC